jgi:hypothetical protein
MKLQPQLFETHSTERLLSSAKADDPVRRDISIHHGVLWILDAPLSAGHDG